MKTKFLVNILNSEFLNLQHIEYFEEMYVKAKFVLRILNLNQFKNSCNNVRYNQKYISIT